MRRVSVVGTSGSGKSTLAQTLAQRLAVPYVELDALMHQPGWAPRPDREFMEELEKVTTQSGWVVDGNYQRFVIEGPVWKRADTVVWLDLPRRTAIRRLFVRTLRRAVTREKLWNDNREPLSNLLSFDPEKSIIAYAWVKHDEFAQRYKAALTDPTWRNIKFIRLRSPAEVTSWLESIRPASES